MWLGLALLAAWCIGRPRGLGPASLLAVAVVLDTPIFSSSQPGGGDNDVVALALLLSALALLFNSQLPDQFDHGRRSWMSPPIALAGTAAGLALATKVTMFAPVGVLAVAVLIALPGWRSRTAWLLPLIAGSVVWFARNLIAFGNPVPAVHLGIGAVSFASAHVPAEGFTLADSLNNGFLWEHLFLPGLHGGMTWMWPIVLAAALAGAILGIVRGPTRLDRGLGVTAVLAVVAYALTPRTGFLFLFATNLRYLGPALAIGTALLFRSSALGAVFRQLWVLVLLAVGVVIEVVDHGPAVLGTFHAVSPTPHLAGTAFLWIGLALAAALALLVLSGRVVAVPGGLALFALAAVGIVLWPAQRHYLRTRYTTGALAFARSLHHQRIGVVGFLQPYPAYGLDLSNRVAEIMHHGPHGGQTLVASCRAWRTAVSTGRYDFVVTSGPYGLLFPSAPDYSAWTHTDPAAAQVSSSPDGFGGTISVFRINGPMHPGLCS